MHLRPYQPSDLCGIADVMTAANATDTLSLYFRRDLDRYPLTDRKSAYRYIKEITLAIGTYCFVMETDPWDSLSSSSSSPSPGPSLATPTPKTSPFTPSIIGWSMYTRHGSTTTALRWQQQNSSLSSAFNRWLMKAEKDYYHSTFRSVYHTHNHTAFASVLPLLSEPWDPTLFAEAWELSALFVHPDWQRRGLGRRLMQWGMERASEERIPLIVGGSALGGPAYRAVGFKSVGVSGFGEFFDEVEFGGEPMQRWVWEPVGVDVIDGAREKAAEFKREWMGKRARK